MRVAIASDHEGFRLKERILNFLESLDYEVVDLGCHFREKVDFPDYAVLLGKALRNGVAQRGILITGTGIGACMAANKIPRVRAALCHDPVSARQSIEDDDANVLCLSADFLGEKLAELIVENWCAARFSSLAQHRRRIEKMQRMERFEPRISRARAA